MLVTEEQARATHGHERRPGLQRRGAQEPSERRERDGHALARAVRDAAGSRERERGVEVEDDDAPAELDAALGDEHGEARAVRDGRRAGVEDDAGGVERERVETACVLTRLAPSFIRIGSFEALNPPAQLFFLGGGQQPADLDGLRVLGEWVARRVLKLPGLRWRDEDADSSGDAWGAKLVLEVARRNAKMVAGWQAYGFMHGVINTDK